MQKTTPWTNPPTPHVSKEMTYKKVHLQIMQIPQPTAAVTLASLLSNHGWIEVWSVHVVAHGSKPVLVMTCIFYPSLLPGYILSHTHTNTHTHTHTHTRKESYEHTHTQSEASHTEQITDQPVIIHHHFIQYMYGGPSGCARSLGDTGASRPLGALAFEV